MPSNPPMDFRTYWNTVGTDNVEKVCNTVGSTMGYFKLLKCGAKKPSGDLAMRIVKAAGRHTPGFSPALELLIAGVPKSKQRRSPSGGLRTPPSPDFLAAQAARRQQRREQRAQ